MSSGTSIKKQITSDKAVEELFSLTAFFISAFRLELNYANPWLRPYPLKGVSCMVPYKRVKEKVGFKGSPYTLFV